MKKWTYEILGRGNFGGFSAQLVQEVREDDTRGERAIFIAAMSWRGDRQPRKVIEWYPGMPFDFDDKPEQTSKGPLWQENLQAWMDWKSVMTLQPPTTASFHGDDDHQQKLSTQWLCH